MKRWNTIIDDNGIAVFYKDYVIPNKKDILNNSTRGLYDVMYYYIGNSLIDIDLTYDELMEINEKELNKHMFRIIKRFADSK